MNCASILNTQRQLRQRLLTPHQARPADTRQRDLAAHLLLYLDEPQTCWELALDWLRLELDADRVDGGTCAPTAATYQACAESRRGDRDVPTMLDTPLSLYWPGIQAALASSVPVFVPSVEHERGLGEGLRTILQAKGTRSKLAMPIRRERQAIGLVCVDWLDPLARPSDARVGSFQTVVQEVLAPVLGAVLDLSQERSLGSLQARLAVTKDALTPAEWRVLQLVARGLSYKEIARQLGRSFSTVDHQLRSIRGKLDVPSTARLVSLLATLN